MQKPSNTYKYIAGEETYKNKDFNQLVMPTQSVEGNSICANSKFIVVSKHYFFKKLKNNFYIDAMVRWWWSIRREEC